MSIPFLFEGVAAIFVCFAIMFAVKDAQYYRHQFKLIKMKLAKLTSADVHLNGSSRNTRLIEW